MVVKLRLAFLTLAVLLLLMMPLGEGSVMLALFVAADLGAAALMLQPGPGPRSKVVPLHGDAENLALLRRIVPELRMRRPGLAIDEQIQWRQATEAHRRRRDLAFALRRD